MTNQRFSFSRLTLSGLLVLATCGAYAQESAYNPNPFQPGKAATVTGAATTIPPASTTASVSTPVLPPATTARVAGDTGPLTLPPPIPVPLPMAVPVEKVWPKPASQPPAPAVAVPGMSTSSSLAANKNDGLPAPAKSEATAAPKKSAFLPREKIEASRARCQVSFKGRSLIQLTAGDAEQAVQMVGANGCLTAISADSDWLDVEYRGNNELVLTAQANTGKAARRGEVTVVTPNKTFVLSVRQAAEPSEPATAPKEKAPVSEPAPAKTVVAPTVQAEPEYDAAKARLADVSDQPLQFTASFKSLVSREPTLTPEVALAPLELPAPAFALVDIVEPKLELRSLEAMRNAGPAISADIPAPPKTAMPQFDLPEVNGPPLELRSLAMLQKRAPAVAEIVPSAIVPTPQFELPDVRGAPLELKSLVALQKEVPPILVRVEDLAPLPIVSIPLPEIAEQAQPLKSLEALRNNTSSVATLSADQLQRPSTPLSLPVIETPAVTVAESPTSPTQKSTSSVDPVRARTIVDAVLSAAEPTFGEAPAAAPVKATPARPAYVPPGYVTLDEYTPTPATKDAPTASKKRTK